MKKGCRPSCWGDPKVTGVLPIALEEATKIVQALLFAGKEYICVMKLHGAVSEDRVKAVLEEFCGVIYQRPPVRSSVKRRVRTRRIYYLSFLEQDERDVLFQVGCEAGTYIRKLCYDIGEVLGVGAHMQELRRTRAGSFTEEDNFVTLHDLAYLQSRWTQTKDETLPRQFIQPMENALDPLLKVYIRDSAVDSICHGAALAAPGVVSVETSIKPNDTLALLTQKGEAIALAKAVASTEQILQMNHGFVARTTRVLMPRGIYPKAWRKNT
jgi:H/ACA ribonucleoprotein complex subunit 4